MPAIGHLTKSSPGLSRHGLDTWEECFGRQRWRCTHAGGAFIPPFPYVFVPLRCPALLPQCTRTAG
jgi:hypothetical protein